MDGIDRNHLQAIIRRAAELYAAETDASDDLSEAEVLRVGEELGLPARLVRQAMYEMAPVEEGRGWIQRVYGPAVVTASRTVHGEAQTTLSLLEEYLSTREYLQLRRRSRDSAWLEPAADAISSMARALARPANRYHVARANRVIVTVRPLDPATSHVRIALDLENRRRGSLLGGVIGGGALGAAVGAGVLAAALTIDPGAMSAFVGAGALAAAGGSAGGIVLASARRFRRQFEDARIEIEGLLDRLQRGDGLDPPPAPWWRRFQRRSPSRSAQARHRAP